MATRKATPRMSPSLPSGKWVTIGLATFAASAAVIVAVGYQALDDGSSPDTRSGGFSASVSGSVNAERKLSPSGNQGFREFDPDIVVPNTGAEAAAPAQSRSMSRAEFVELDLGGGANTGTDLTPFFENIGDLGGLSSPSTRTLSPSGNQGFREFDPDIVTPNVAAGASSERQLSPTGRQGSRDFDPEILYPNQ